MRRKIAKRLRREILRLGATIKEEGWISDEDGEYVGKTKLPVGIPSTERCFAVKVECNGWKIFSADDDELGVYRVVLDCVKQDCKEPFVPVGGSKEGNIDEE